MRGSHPAVSLALCLGCPLCKVLVGRPRMQLELTSMCDESLESQPSMVREDAQIPASDDACEHLALPPCVLAQLGVDPHVEPLVAGPPPARQRKLSLDLDSVSLLVCMPFLSMLTCAYMYASLPLYFLDQSESGHNWYTLTKLGFILLTGNMLRVLMNVLTNKVGDTVYLVQLSAAFATSVWMLVDPQSIAALVIAMTLATSSNYILALQGLAFARYNTNGSEQLHIRALKVLTTTEVLGYSIATVVGGVMYDFGGWRACVWLQTACLLLMLLCSLGSPTVRADCRLWLGMSGIHFGKADSGNGVSGSGPIQKSSAEGKQLAKVMPSLDYWPVLLVLAAHSTNAASYTVEWSLFAAFFREEFGWSSSWTGMAQSSGDLLAAGFLLLQACTGGTEDEEPTSHPAHDIRQSGTAETAPTVKPACAITGFAAWSKYPFNLSVLLFVTAGLDFTIAQPSFICAVIAQVRRA